MQMGVVLEQKIGRVGSRGKNSLAHQPTQSAMSTGVPATTAPVTTMAAPTTTYAAPTTTYGGCDSAAYKEECNRIKEMLSTKNQIPER